MSDIYKIAGITRQGHWKALRHDADTYAREQFVVNEVCNIRRYHPRMGAKKLYLIIRPEGIGRDRFIELLSQNQLLLKAPRNPRRTTYSVKHTRYVNLLDGLIINGPDQVWVSDITYFSIGDETYYIAMVMDLYTRQVLGASVRDNMCAELCLEALEQAFKKRGKRKFGNTLIHHSDRGTQYLSNKFITQLEESGIRTSVSFMVLENTHMERLNGIIKNEYLIPKNPKDHPQLRKTLNSTVRLYNNERPHWELGMMTPDQYEIYVNGLTLENRIQMEAYVDPETTKRAKLRNQLTIFDQ